MLKIVVMDKKQELNKLIKEQWLDKNDIKPVKEKKFKPKNKKIKKDY